MTKKLDFKKINSLALAQAENVVSHYAPNGKLEGREWVAIDPSRNDNSARSFSVNVETGLWADFATNDKGGDLVSYVAHCLRISQGDAYKTLAHFLGVSNEEICSPKINPLQPLQNAKQKEPDFISIFPPPPEAEGSCPLKHPILGRPTGSWDYKSADGRLLSRVNRYDRADSDGKNKKEFRVAVYGSCLIKKGVNAGTWRLGWHFRQLPDERPLYGQELLSGFPEAAPIILVEGEKACDAARKLFPDRPCMTWSGGSKAIGKTDFSPLAKRDVWLWPDNDEAGQQTISALEKTLSVVDVNTFRTFDLTAFVKYSPGVNGELLNVLSEWPIKADAHDAVAMGWTNQHLAALEKCNALLSSVDGETKKSVHAITPIENSQVIECSDSSPPGHAVPYGFKVDDNGVYWYDSKAEKYRRICARLDVVAMCRDASEEGNNWGVFVRFKNLDGREKYINFPRELFGTDGGVEVTKQLLKMGLYFDAHRESKRKVIEYVQASNTQDRIGLVGKMGWHKNAFVLPDRTIGETNEPLLFYTEGANLCKLSERGTLNDWKENVSKYCIGNPLALFAVSAAFSAPLVELLGIESIAFHFHGDSSWGKSTLLNIPCSAYGNPEHYKKSWRASDNGLEGLAAHHDGMLLALDEINQMDSRKIGEVIYMMINGAGKTRANDRGGARDDLHKWKFTFLSNGEKTLEQYMGEAGKIQTAGQEMRFLEIRATMLESEADIKRMGVFTNPHGLAGGAALSELLKVNMAQSHGTAFPAFITALVRELEGDKRGGFISKMHSHIDNFRKKHLTENASGQVIRAATKFGLVAWAGEYASHWGITGWQQGHAISAASQCFKSWLAARGSDGNFEEKQMLEHIRHTISKYGQSRFRRWDGDADDKNTVIDSHVPATAECWGFRRELRTKCYLDGDSSDVVFYIFKDAFKNDICKGYDHNRIAKILCSLNALQPTKSGDGKTRMDRKEKLPDMGAKRVWCYKVTQSALFSDSDGDEVSESALVI